MSKDDLKDDLLERCPICGDLFTQTPECRVCSKCQAIDPVKMELGRLVGLAKEYDLELRTLKLRVELLEAKMSQVLPDLTEAKMGNFNAAIERRKG